jgi:hypothetical protein
MRKAVTVVLLLFTVAASAQKQVADSILIVLAKQKTDSLQTNALLSYMEKADGLYDSATYYPNQIFKIGQEAKNTDVQALGYGLLGYYYFRHNDPSRSFELYLNALKFAEQQNNPKVLLRVYHFMSFYGDPKNSVDYQQKVLGLARQTGELNWETLATYTIGQAYLEKIQQYDSALVYLQRAYELNLRLAKTGKPAFAHEVWIPTDLGRTFLKLKNPTLALAYFRLALQAANKQGGKPNRPYYGLANYFKEIGNRDSAFYYASKLYKLSEEGDAFPIALKAEAANLLYGLYKESRKADSALKYHELYKEASDSANSTLQAQKIENLQAGEKERQRQLAEKKEKEEEDRRHNLQYAAIAFGLVTLLGGFLVLSHSVVANQRMIKFLGVVSLLIIFEFSNLLLHPWLGAITHHSPVLMLLAMVCVAGLLVPLHHRIEHWTIHKLVEKNNRIRLAAARKTIAKLEGNGNGVPLEKGTEAQHGLEKRQAE